MKKSFIDIANKDSVIKSYDLQKKNSDNCRLVNDPPYAFADGVYAFELCRT